MLRDCSLFVGFKVTHFSSYDFSRGKTNTSVAHIKHTDPIIIKGPKQSSVNRTGNNKFPTTAPIRPTTIVTLRAIVLKDVGKVSTTTLFTIVPPILDNATNTDDIARIPLESSAQYRIPQQTLAPMKHTTIKIFLLILLTRFFAIRYPINDATEITIELIYTVALTTFSEHSEISPVVSFCMTVTFLNITSSILLHMLVVGPSACKWSYVSIIEKSMGIQSLKVFDPIVAPH